VLAAADPTTIRSKVRSREVKEAGLIAAQVGDEVITIHDLGNAVKERVQGKLPPGQRLSHEELNKVAEQVLDQMIDRKVILQEVRRKLKDHKKLDQINAIAEKAFRENELPGLLRKFAAANETELKQKLEEKGQTLDEKRQAFRDEFLTQGFIEQEVGPRLKVGLPEMRDYYNAHLKDFDQPAQWTWREVVIEFKKYPSRADARRKADAVLARLRRGDEFAEVARAESDGPNKKQGGLWEKMAPGSYLVSEVNDALNDLPLRQVSQVIEGPNSYHVVRVEERREPGPARFDEVQDKLRESIRQQKIEREMNAYIEKLRGRTLVVKNTNF
jgi:peptidyl-prolyl cis-trans isomerase SurA